MVFSICHPERQHIAKGLCKSCYAASRPKDSERNRIRITKWLSIPENRERKRAYDRELTSRIRKRFLLKGISEQDYIVLLNKQGGICGACGAPKPGGMGRWHIDHDHSCCSGERSCGKCIRGLLCSKCNTGLGMANDDPDILIKWIKYLKDHDGRQT